MKTRFVAEVSSNHYRAGIAGREHLERALAFVDEAARMGCHAVKFQQFKIDQLFAPVALQAHAHLNERKRWELPESFNAELAARAHEKKIAFASTPFYLAAVERLAPLVDFFKVASYQLPWLQLLGEVARTGKPVVLATGMAKLEEVREAVACLRHHGCTDLELLHCVSLYPTPAEEANLAAIETLRREFGTRVGWSDHTCKHDVIRRAVRRFGASMVEFHLDLDCQGAEYEAGHCWLPGEVHFLLQELSGPGTSDLRNTLPMDGDGRKEPRPAEGLERGWRTDPSDGLRPELATRRRLVKEVAA